MTVIPTLTAWNDEFVTLQHKHTELHGHFNKQHNLLMDMNLRLKVLEAIIHEKHARFKRELETNRQELEDEKARLDWKF